MAEQLQALLDRINEEGVKKTGAECEKLLAAAREQAAGIRAAAEADAKQTLAKAKKEADLLVEKGREALRQAARDTLLSLRRQLQERMQKVVKTCVTETLAGDSLIPLLAEVVKACAKDLEGDNRLEVFVPPAELAQLEKELLARLGNDLRDAPEFSPEKSVRAGFKLKIAGAEVVYDFTDEALADVLCQYLNPKLAELIR